MSGSDDRTDDQRLLERLAQLERLLEWLHHTQDIPRYFFAATRGGSANEPDAASGELDAPTKERDGALQALGAAMNALSALMYRFIGGPPGPPHDELRPVIYREIAICLQLAERFREQLTPVQRHFVFDPIQPTLTDLGR